MSGKITLLYLHFFYFYHLYIIIFNIKNKINAVIIHILILKKEYNKMRKRKIGAVLLNKPNLSKLFIPHYS